ncbi:675_t:CDS:2, partial [Paraglomus brasilianum]
MSTPLYPVTGYPGTKKTSLPFDVSTTTRNGTLGIVSLSSESAFSYGSYGSFGPKVEIFYRLHGTTKGIGRPDYCNVTYQIAGVNAKDKEIGMNVTVADKSFLDKLIESAIGGVFWVNEKAFEQKEDIECVVKEILNVLKDIWNNSAFDPELAKTLNEGTHQSTVIVPAIRASLKNLPIGDAFFISTSENPQKKTDYEIKLWRETNDGLYWVRQSLKPDKEQFGIV